MKPLALFLFFVLLQIPANAIGLQSGDHAPLVTLRDADGKPVALHSLLHKQASLLVFYRGGWCPYCNRHLSDLKDIQGDLAAAGVQVIAISPDNPDHVSSSINKLNTGYTLLSDSSLDAAKAFKIAFTLDEKTLKKLESYEIDIHASSGESHNMLPHPAAFLITKDGQIHFSHVNEDYKTRVSNKEILKAVEKISSESKE